jgi:DNA modification methylase
MTRLQRRRTAKVNEGLVDAIPVGSRLGRGLSEIEHIPPDRLRPHAKNPHTHSKGQIRQIARSYKKFGRLSVVVINKDNVILSGHGRVEAAKLLGLKTIECVRVTDLAPAEEVAFLLADNKIQENAGYDTAVLAQNFEFLLQELPTEIEVTGWAQPEIDRVLLNHAEKSQPVDDVPSDWRKPPVTRRDDCWILDAHRLVCGDARDRGTLARLMGGQKAQMASIDIPYNVPVLGHVSGRGTVQHAEFAFASGEMTERQFSTFTKRSLKVLADNCAEGALLYCFIDWRHAETMCAAGRSLGFELINICIWTKTAPGQGAFYRSAHEMIVVFAKPGASTVNHIRQGRFGRNRTNVWSFPAPNKFKAADDPLSAHPTPKPVALITEAIKDASDRGRIVLDTFLGSGTTILAAETVGRLGYGVEYEPVYCDLSIRRWQEMTGKDAMLAGTGQTFAEVAEARAADHVSLDAGVR